MIKKIQQPKGRAEGEQELVVSLKTQPDKSNIPAIQEMLLRALEWRRLHSEFFPEDHQPEGVSTATDQDQREG